MAHGWIIGILVVLAFSAAIYYMMSRGGTTPAAIVGGDSENLVAESPSQRNFGGVGARLIGTNAPLEYMRGSGVEIADNIGKSASSAISASSAVVVADMNTSEATIKTNSRAENAMRDGGVIEDIKFATKGDGQIRPVAVDGNKVDSDLIKLSMFENQDFMYHLQAPERAMPHLQDPSLAPQKSMFRKMTYPLVWQGGTLGMDVIRNSDDTRATVSFTGGRPPVN